MDIGERIKVTEALKYKSQDSAGEICTILRVMRYTLKRRFLCLAIGEDACHGKSTCTTDLAF